ncbi:CaiB/BaiF CoA-transferase family protein [Trujillonella endophytica]|uniref:Crotonobetainyl-CoA:carnitine CoA-transferase CaiB n=1 Tax=Trujillonella endophytica TaxID=673521 RepID=A0A1H8QRR4_9ACTN|nr:CoA transferase [Trujillella endophytica]SEO56892.1 Crotonobetainyl-CoA:carnitine CoA-transferase CaiB [Trujillella endophytica]
MASTSDRLPLAGVRVVEMTDGFLDMAGRLLADFGADVIKVETAGSREREAAGNPERTPDVDDTDVRHLIENFNKSGVALDPSDATGAGQLWRLLESADIVILANQSARVEALDPEEVHSRLPHLVVLAVSDFGRTGPYKDFVGTDAVHLALGSQLSRSGFWPREPALVPFDLAYHSSAAQAAWAALVAYFERLQSGRGDLIDFSVFEATIEVVDPPFGTAGTATAGTKQTQAPTDPYSSEWTRPRSKPYPIYPCADGYVRCLVLAPGQWRAMYGWLGEPDEFADPKYQTILGRDREQAALERAYVELFRDKTKAELAVEGQKRGVPIAPVLSPTEVAVQEHFEQRGAFVDAEISPGLRAVIPSGFLEIDGERIGYRRRAPEPGEHNALLSDLPASSAARPAASDPADGSSSAAPSLPLSGLRVIDFGSIVFGAEAGRLFADLGADVIKIENAAFPDKYRGGSEPGSLIAKNFALGNRGRRSFGVDTRTEAGRDLVKGLVATADVVVSNFKPGTLERLGLGYDELSAVNPKIVWMSSSGFGDTGAWASWLAYGPAVRSASGLTHLWRYPDDPGGFGDTTTVYPDHQAARMAGLAVLSAVIRSRATGKGANIRVSQAEVVLNHLSEEFARDALGLSSPEAKGAPWGVYECAGDDEWCAICVRDDADWANFRSALGNPSWAGAEEFADAHARRDHHEALDGHVRDWAASHTADSVMTLLQSHGVPAGAMKRPPELLDDPQLLARDYLALQDQPGFAEPLNTVRRPFLARRIQSSPVRPSPEMGQDTVAICSELLGMSAAEIDRLTGDGVLQTADGSR